MADRSPPTPSGFKYRGRFAALSKKATRQAANWPRLTTRHLLVVETTLPEDEWRARLDARPRAASTHKVTGWDAMQQQLATYQDCWRYPIAPHHHLVVDTTQPINLLVMEVVRRITALQSQVAFSQSETLPTATPHMNRDTDV